MSEYVRKQLPVIAVIFAIGVLTSAFALMQLKRAVPGIDVNTFETFSLIIPCAAIALCSLAIMLLAQEIGRQLFVVVTSTCVVAGAIALVVVSAWMADASFAALLAEHSAEGSVIVAPINAPLIIVRDIAAFFVCSVIGSIIGAWLGSRLHPVRATDKRSNKKNKR